MKVTDIVRFSEVAHNPCLAAQWCAQHKLTGVVTGTIGDRVEIDAGLPYKITERVENLEFVANQADAPPTTY